MAGRGEIEAQDLEPNPRILTFTQDGQWRPAIAPLHFDKPKMVGVGLGRSFALEYVKDHPGVTVGLIPCAVGGSAIDAWTPGGFHEQTQSHPFDDALKRIEMVRGQGVFQGILWHQGESDANPSSAPAYEAKLAALIDRLRSALDAPELPFIIGQLGDFPGKPWESERLRVDAAHKRLSHIVSRCEFVHARGLSDKGDQTHFDAASYRELGRRYYQAFERLSQSSGARLIQVQRIWDAAPHNAFTDLIRFQQRWYCVFREGQKHVSADGALRLIASSDGQSWESVARFENPQADLRDAKLSVTPDGQLMVLGAGAWHQPTAATHQSFAWFSQDGRDWSEAEAVGEPNYWLWRVVWQNSKAIGWGYRTGGESKREVRLYESADGKDYQPIVEATYDQGYPNESDIVFMGNGFAFCLLRRDPFAGDRGNALLGRALPPYREWQWRELPQRVGGPAMLALPDGRIVAAVRLYDGHTRTSLCWLDAEQTQLHEFLRLPSAGDTSYCGLVWHEDRLWVSYYSGHEAEAGKFGTAIYLAQVTIP